MTESGSNGATTIGAETQPVVLYDVADRIATVTLNRPRARNAISRALRYALWDAVTAAGDDVGVDVVILTGADPAFCAGMDLREMSGESPSPVPPRAPGEGPGRDQNGMSQFLPLIDKPVIGAVNGPTATGGLEVALQCTFLVASDRARFADTHGRVGIMPGGGLTVLLPQAVGLRRAIEMSLTGNFLTAAEALAAGLVNHVVPHAELLPFARRLASDIVSCDQRAVRLMLRHYRRVAAAATKDEAHLLEFRMRERWRPEAGGVAARRTSVIARGRAQNDQSQPFPPAP
jgi:enoyl-CoA hydratase